MLYLKASSYEDALLNLARVMDALYKYKDLYTHSGMILKDYIPLLLLVQPIDLRGLPVLSDKLSFDLLMLLQTKLVLHYQRHIARVFSSESHPDEYEVIKIENLINL